VRLLLLWLRASGCCCWWVVAAPVELQQDAMLDRFMGSAWGRSHVVRAFQQQLSLQCSGAAAFVVPMLASRMVMVYSSCTGSISTAYFTPLPPLLLACLCPQALCW
jgi:hypothetical protein